MQVQSADRWTAARLANGGSAGGVQRLPLVAVCRLSACVKGWRVDSMQQANRVAVDCAGWHWGTAHR